MVGSSLISEEIVRQYQYIEICNNRIHNTVKIYRKGSKGSLKVIEPDAEGKGLQRRITYKNGIFDGRNKKPSPPPDDQTWVHLELQTGERCVTLFANTEPEPRRVCRQRFSSISMEK